MMAAVLRRFGELLRIEELPWPRPQGGEVLVRVRAAGVCRSDLDIIAGGFPDLPLPRVLGHEVAGEAEGLGEVLVYPLWGCGACAACGHGEEQRCPRVAAAGWQRDGGYAEAMVVPSARYLLPLDGLDPVRAAPLAGAGLVPYRAVRRARPWLADGEVAVVLGAGDLERFAVQYLRLLTGARVLVVDPDGRRRQQALAAGADAAVPPGEELPPARAVLEFTGAEAAVAAALRMVARGGVVVAAGEAVGKGAARPAPQAGGAPREAHLTTSAWGSLDELRAVLDLAREGALHWDVEAFPLEQVNLALDRLRRGGAPGRLVARP